MLGVWLMSYIADPALFHKTRIKIIYNVVRKKLKPG